jgi:FkbM family methyltransferase
VEKRIKQAKKYLEWQKPNQAIAELKPTLDSKQIQKQFKWVPQHMMGIALSLKAEHEASAAYLEKAVDYGSEEPETYHMLSVNYFHLGRFGEAEKHGKEAVKRREDFLKAWLNLGSVYRSQAKLDEALKCYQKANELDPSNAGVAFRLGEIYRDQGDLDQAMELFDITLQVDEDHIKAMLEKADILKKRGSLEEALTNLDEARDIHGDHPAIGISEAEVARFQGDYDKAITIYESTLEEYPESGPLRINYALCLQEVGRFDQSEKHYRQAIEDTEDSRNAISNYLMGLHYNPKNSRQHIYKEHLRLGKAFGVVSEEENIERLTNADPAKTLKVGFISGGFRRHPVGWMIAGALEQLPAEDFELHCYTTDNRFDFVTRRIHKNIDHWQSVKGYSDDVTENIIRDDELDILVDLSGHAADNCLNVMANRPAPIMVKWVGGLFNTTGLEAFDYLITDRFESPEGEEQYYTEKLVRMPDDYITYTPPAYVAEVADLPAKKNGYITFGCFNNPTKVNEVVLRHWADIMRQVPESRLLLKSKQYDTASFRDQILEIMDDQGIGNDRITFKGRSSHDDHIGCYNDVDIALDPWPYSGGLTTCEALYMGVPVITLPGPTFAGRHSTTHLINAGLEQWVTDNWEEYTEKTVALAKDRDRLKKWRSKLRNQLLNSPVCDGKRFGAHLSVAFREMWKQFLNGYQKRTDDWANHITIDALTDENINRLTDGPDVTPLITVKDTGIPKQEKSNKNDSKAEMMNESVIDTEKLVQGIEQLENGNGSQNQQTEAQQYSDSANDPAGSWRDETYQIETQDGVTICTPSDADILTTYVLLEQEQWFEPELDLVRDYLQPGMTVIDAGAGFGAYSLPIAKQVGVEGTVYAFEPGVEAKKHLELSKIDNDFNQLEVLGRGLDEHAGEDFFEVAKTPELNRVSEDGEETVSLTSLDAWWGFAGRPEVDFMKLDVNGMEADVLTGGSWMFEETKPVILASIGEHEENLKTLQSQLKAYGYQLFEYISGPELLAEYDPDAGVDPYKMNIIGIPECRVEEFKKSGWIFDKNVEPESADVEEWKEYIEQMPWAESQMEKWEKQIDTNQHQEYLHALSLVCAAEQMETSDTDSKSRSRKGATMLTAAQKLIGLFNNGQAGVAAAMTYVRLMSQLGKQSQAVEMAKQLMETVNSGKDISAELPFLPPLPEQDTTAVETDFTNWLTVRTVEAWISLKNPTTYMTDKQEQNMLKALEGNPELSSGMKKAVALVQDNSAGAFGTRLNNWFWNAENGARTHISSVNEKAGNSTALRHLYLGYPGKKGGAHGVHEIRAKKIAREIEKKGIDTTIVSTSEPEFIEALSTANSNAGYACYSGVMGYDLKVQADMGVTGNIFDLIDMPVFAFLGDHPYTDFMWGRIVNSSNDTIFLTSIPSLKNEMEQIFPNTSVKLLGNMFPLSDQPKNLKPIEKRPTDVLVPWGLHKFFTDQKSLKQKLKELGPKQKKLGIALHNEAVQNYDKSILDIFSELYQDQFGHHYHFGEKKTKEDFRWLKVLSLVDWTVRKDRRITMLKEQLSSLPDNYRVIVTAHSKLSELIPKLKEKNIEWIGEVSKEHLNQLYRDSKIVLNCNPTFLDNVHARIYEGLTNGCFVVSDFNHALKQTFWEEDAIGIVSNGPEGKSLTDYITKDWSIMQEKTDWGYEIIQQSFTAEGHAKSIIEVIAEKIGTDSIYKS